MMMERNKKMKYKLQNGDCLEIMQEIPDKSVDLILIDPPYNISKAEWDKWETTEKYVEFMGKVFKENERVLKDNGSFYFFHNDFLQIVELQNWINKNTNFVFKQLITWNKKHFKKFAWSNRNPKTCKDRNWFPNVEYCLYYTFQNDNPMRSSLNEKTEIFKPIFDYFSEEQLKTGLNNKELDKIMGRKAAFSYFKKRTSHGIEFPIKEHYKRLQETGYFQKPYEELKQKYEGLKQKYEETRYTFNLKEVQENISCVWENDDKNSGKLHPCEKPLDILEKIIKTSSNENDVVLDCFMGSGSTGVACLNTNRKFIGIELDNNFFNIAEKRIKETKND